MPLIDRRSLLAAGAAATAAGLSGVAPQPARAAAPAASRQVPGIYRYRVGEFEVTAVNDGAAARPLQEGFVRNAKLDEVQGALEAAFLPPGEITIPFTTMVVNTGSRLVLIDTGTGGQMAPTAGMLLQNFEAAGIDPTAIDTVIISHFHGDHIMGLRSREGDLAFANAEIAVPEAEWAFWMDEGEMSRAAEGAKGNFANARRVFGPSERDIRRFAAEAEVVPGITAIPAYGHTPGHTAFRIASGSEQLIVLSDTTNHPALFVRNPTWQAAFDMDGAMAAETRRRMLDMVAAERALVAGYHFPFPAAGHIAKDGERYRLVPVAWTPII